MQALYLMFHLIATNDSFLLYLLLEFTVHAIYTYIQLLTTALLLVTLEDAVIVETVL